MFVVNSCSRNPTNNTQVTQPIQGDARVEIRGGKFRGGKCGSPGVQLAGGDRCYIDVLFHYCFHCNFSVNFSRKFYEENFYH